MQRTNMSFPLHQFSFSLVREIVIPVDPMTDLFLSQRWHMSASETIVQHEPL